MLTFSMICKEIRSSGTLSMAARGLVGVRGTSAEEMQLDDCFEPLRWLGYR